MALSIIHTQGQFEVENAKENGAMDWKAMLAYVTDSVDEQLLLRNELSVPNIYSR